MKKIFAVVLAIVMLLTLGGTALADKPLDKIDSSNGAPSGAHYNLNIIGLPKGVGYDKDLNDNFTGGNGARIFVSRKGTTSIYVQGRNEPYQVLDHDGTDSVVGEHGTAGDPGTPGIILPYDGGEYKCDIYVRLVGPKGSEIHWQGKKYEAGDYVAIDTGFTLKKEEGGTKFQLKNSQLLADGYENLLWELSGKEKFRICQVRIYVDEGY
jgi:hypothetical protein